MENKVYAAISAVQAELSDSGISKDRTNTQGFSFKYRGIDDTYNTLAPILSKNKLCILPRMVSKEVVERTSAKGGTLIYTTVAAEYDFVSAEDGSKHVVGPIYGEAMDSGDKSIGKAMSYAYKSMAFMTFSIPTDGENDPDAQTHELAWQQPSTTKPAGTPVKAVQAPTGNGRACVMCAKTFVPDANYPNSTTCSWQCAKAKKEGGTPQTAKQAAKELATIQVDDGYVPAANAPREEELPPIELSDIPF